MALTQRLDLRQSQTLVMTPQLQQAIKLLQLSNIELTAFVEGELERNPLLERDEGLAAPVVEPEPSGDPTSTSDIPTELVDASDRVLVDALPATSELPLDMDYERAPSGDDGTDTGALEAGLSSWSSSGGGERDDDELGLDQTLSREIGLKDHLSSQLGLDAVDPTDRLIGSHLVDMVDDAGYLPAELDELADRLGCPIERIERTLALLQRFDPPGIFARSLKECLALQLKDRNRYDPCMAALLDNLPMLAARDIEGLKRVCGVDADDLAEMIAEVKALDPKPGLRFEPMMMQPVVPDVVVRPQTDGGWLVELNTETLPRVLVNRRYYAKVARGGLKREEKEYLSERLQSANWLVKSLDQRANTILKTASEIVRQQEAFLDHGVQHLRPLILRDIAEAISMHESTISRVTTNKYIATPRGIYELKYFFTTAIASSSGGSAHSAEAVRHRIKIMIDAESPDSVLSDDKIVEILLADGVDIARRTVAKYRDALRIPSSVQRRREKAMPL